MSLLYTILIGLLVGIVAKLIMPGKDPGGFIVTTLIGIAGAMVAKFVGQAMNWYAEGDTAGFIASVLGAIVLLVIYRAITGKRKSA